jgi:hypothetical protein
MTYSIYLALALATAARHDPEGMPEATSDLTDVLGTPLARIRQLVEGFRRGPLSPLTAAQFEKDLQQATRELARVVAQWAYNHLEPADAEALLPEVHCAGSRFRRLRKKTPQPIDTLFGTIALRRWGYRAAPADGEPVLFPLSPATALVTGAPSGVQNALSAAARMAVTGRG